MEEKLRNFGVMYGLQWLVYVATQGEIIRRDGSLSNWTQNPWATHFDRDSFDYNIFKHAVSGQYYFQYYRSLGYLEREAFTWAFISSLAFEYTIETVTEAPSWQDIYQTPVYGSILGMGLERLSFFFLSQSSWPSHVLGYILNPFSLLPDSTYGLSVVPTIDGNQSGVLVSWRFP